MALATYAVRVLPMTLIRKPIRNTFIRSFLYYVPYVTLAVMIFPAIMNVTQYPVAGLIALIAGIILAWRGVSMFNVAIICCISVFITEAAIGIL